MKYFSIFSEVFDFELKATNVTTGSLKQSSTFKSLHIGFVNTSTFPPLRLYANKFHYISDKTKCVIKSER